MENIGLQDSLLSRFDLLFVLLDVADSDQDEMISDFVVRMHRYRNPKEQDGDVLPMGGSFADKLSTFSAEAESEVSLAIRDALLKFFTLSYQSIFHFICFFVLQSKETTVYEKYDQLLHGNSRKRDDQILSVEFMRKYIHIAKCLKPKLSDRACELIANEYSRLRSQDLDKSDIARTQPVTARTLETLIRLATAHAKARMAKLVSPSDAHVAIELVQFAYFKKVLEKEKRKRTRSDNESGDEVDEDITEADVNGTQESQPNVSSRKRTRLDDITDDDAHLIDPPDSGDLTRRETRSSKPSTSTATTGTLQSSEDMFPDTEPEPVVLSDGRLATFRQKVQAAFHEARQQTISVANLTEKLNHDNTEPFSAGEIESALLQMTDANQVMVSDDVVFLI